ncbi:MAG: AhpC/TSA family protein [Bacteroidales bacterium]|nr:AhpC/TSA family protein [Bacteroidales bacterium]
MRKWTVWALALLLLAACNQTPVARISGTVENAKDSSVILQKLNFNRLVPVDTIRTDVNGKFNYKVKLTGNEPYFYYLYLGDSPVASMVLLPSDQVTVKVPAQGPFEIEGSEESQLLKEVNAAFAETSAQMEAVSASLTENSTDEEIRAANAALSKLYVAYKRNAIKHVITHPKSITSAVVLFQRFNENLPVFGQESDAVIFRTVQDSLSTVYPKSEFLTALRDQLDARARDLEIATRFGEASLISFPELALPDVDGNIRLLSDLEGAVIVLSFWSVAQDEHKMFNVELAELYRKYHDRGLEVYQVSLDIDKPSWAATVKSQALPWISVNDGLGIESPSVVAYNIDHIPSMFVIDREGGIAATDLFDQEALDQLIRKIL